jgi:hypothetical protein
MDNKQLILQGIAIDELFGQLRDLIQSELKKLPERQDLPQVGGIELAERITGLSKASIYRFTSQDTIPHFKKGGKLFFKADDLMKWIEST